MTSKSPSLISAFGQTSIPPPYERPFATAINMASVEIVRVSVVTTYLWGLKRGNSNAMAALYFMGPLGQLIELAFSLTTESKPEERIAPNHSPSTSPKSIGCGLVVMICVKCSSIASKSQPSVLKKSFPVPAGIRAKGICVGTTTCKITCINPSPPTAMTPSHSGFFSTNLCRLRQRASEEFPVTIVKSTFC